MIDQTKDKKDDVLASKIEADKDQKQKTGLPQAMKDPAKVDPEKAQKLAQIEKEKAELSKAQKGADKLKEQAGNNASKAMQPIGSARVMQKAEVHSEPGKTGTPVFTKFEPRIGKSTSPQMDNWRPKTMRRTPKSGIFRPSARPF